MGAAWHIIGFVVMLLPLCAIGEVKATNIETIRRAFSSKNHREDQTKISRGTQIFGLTHTLRIRCRGGSSTFANEGRAADFWDVHVLTTRQGDVAVFRHKDLGTAVELHERSPGFFTFITHDRSNVTTCASHGELLPPSAQTPLITDGLNHLDQFDGFLAPDTLCELRRQAGRWPMVAEWMDLGNWEAFDDGRAAAVLVANHFSGAALGLARDGLVFVGAPVGPAQDRRPRGVAVTAGGGAEQLEYDEAARRLARLLRRK